MNAKDVAALLRKECSILRAEDHILNTYARETRNMTREEAEKYILDDFTSLTSPGEEKVS